MLCPRCSQMFTSNSQSLPRILVHCGHTLCTSCVESISTSRDHQISIICPECKTENIIQSIEKLPKNIAILTIDNKKQRKTTDQGGELCSIHQKSLEAYCQDDGELLCIDCIINRNENQKNSLLQNEKMKSHQNHNLISIDQGVHQVMNAIKEQSSNIQQVIASQLIEQSKNLKDNQIIMKQQYIQQQQQIICFFEQVKKEIENKQQQLLTEINDKYSKFNSQAVQLDFEIQETMELQDQYMTQSEKIQSLNTEKDSIRFLKMNQQLHGIYQKLTIQINSSVKDTLLKNSQKFFDDFNEEKEITSIFNIIKSHYRSPSPMIKHFNSTQSFVNTKSGTKKFALGRQSITRKSFLNSHSQLRDLSSTFHQNSIKPTNIEDDMKYVTIDHRENIKNPIVNHQIKKSLSSTNFFNHNMTKITKKPVQNGNFSKYLNQASEDITKNKMKSSFNNLSSSKIFISQQQTARQSNLRQTKIIPLQNIRNNQNSSILSERKNHENPMDSYSSQVNRASNLLSRLSNNQTSSQNYKQNTTKLQKTLRSKSKKKSQEKKENTAIEMKKKPLFKNKLNQPSIISTNHNSSTVSQIHMQQSPISDQLIKVTLVPHEAAVSYLVQGEDKKDCQNYQMSIKRNPFKNIEVNIPDYQRNKRIIQGPQINFKDLVESTENIQPALETQFEDINFDYHSAQVYQEKYKLILDKNKSTTSFTQNSEEEPCNEASQEICINKISNKQYNFRSFQEPIITKFNEQQLPDDEEEEQDKSYLDYFNQNEILQHFMNDEKILSQSNDYYQQSNASSYNY